MEVTSRSKTNGRDFQNQGYGAVVDNYRCTNWTDPGRGPALKKKSDNSLLMSQTSFQALKKGKGRKRAKEEKGDKKLNEESDEKEGYGPALVVIRQEK